MFEIGKAYGHMVNGKIYIYQGEVDNYLFFKVRWGNPEVTTIPKPVLTTKDDKAFLNKLMVMESSFELAVAKKMLGNKKQEKTDMTDTMKNIQVAIDNIDHDICETNKLIKKLETKELENGYHN